MRGVKLAMDGAFGPGTAAAVREFQRSSGLAVDGVAGPRTLAELEKTLCDSIFGTCVYYFDAVSTRKIHDTLDKQNDVGEQAGVLVACRVLKDPRAVAVCRLLGPVGVDKVRDAARTAVEEDACLAINLGTVPVRVYSDGGGNCRRTGRAPVSP